MPGKKDDSLFLGLDIGTSGVKAILVSPAGAVAAAATVPLSLDTPCPGWAEQDPQAWWDASTAAIRRVLEQGPAGARRVERERIGRGRGDGSRGTHENGLHPARPDVHPEEQRVRHAYRAPNNSSVVSWSIRS